MASWLRGTSWFQRIALALLLAAVFRTSFGFATGGSKGAVFLILAALLALFAFRRQMLWRVRNRLALTYFLFGVVPILLILGLLQVVAVVILSQYAAERVRQDVVTRTERVRVLTEDLLLAASYNAPPAAMEEILKREPMLRAIVRKNGKVTQLPAAGGVFTAAPSWVEPGYAGLLQTVVEGDTQPPAAKKSSAYYFLGAHLKREEGNADVFTYLPLDEATLATITPGVTSVAGIAGDITKGDEPNVDVQMNTGGSTVTVEANGQKSEVTSSRLPEKKSFWDVTVVGILPWKALAASDSPKNVTFIALARPSRLLEGVATGQMAGIAMIVLLFVGGFLLVVEIISLISTVSLTRTITRSVHDLYQGTLHVASNDFSHRIPVRGKHQLSDLAASFNGMTTQIGHYLGEMRKKEKLESELEIAREVQSRLFPRTVPELKTLEMAGVCLPGRFVSGDYYDFVRLDDRFTAIALGDVSGKGVSAALLMASIQSSLHAQLKFSGSALSPSLSTAALMALISQQLYESTPVEKYATFFCSVYDDEAGSLRYTNCGHLKPILVRGNAVSTLDGGGLVVGLLPNVTYEQMEIQLQSGDLLAIYSDGVSEAENATEDQFGEARLADLLAKHVSEPLDNIIEIVTTAVHAWIHDPDGQDDTTIVLIRRK